MNVPLENPDPSAEFVGAKVAILRHSEILTILRDDIPTIPWPGHWDLPGGGREGEESSVECVLRETKEEIGVDLKEADLTWRSAWNSAGKTAWFFVAELPDFDVRCVHFGDEGQAWRMAEVTWFLSHNRHIPALAERLKYYLTCRA